MGIRQRLVSEAGFIINSNPIRGRWEHDDIVSVDEVPLKGQLIDRLDLVFIFRKATGEAETNAYADNMYRISQKHFKLDFLFLRKYIYLVLHSEEFDSISFEDNADTLRLRDFWKNLMKDSPEFAGNRSFESVFKLAKALARLTLKTAVDSETVDQIISYISRVFAKHGKQITQPVDYFTMTFLDMCNIIKKHSTEKAWIEQNSPNAVQLTDITFNQTAELAANNNPKIREYLGTNYRSTVNKAARKLREKFRDSEDKDFDNGKIKIISSATHELMLRWVPNTLA
jgi:DNA replicative helicase MCM subunit Mcm2 (Cdc46/Mcm family)